MRSSLKVIFVIACPNGRLICLAACLCWSVNRIEGHDWSDRVSRRFSEDVFILFHVFSFDIETTFSAIHYRTSISPTVGKLVFNPFFPGQQEATCSRLSALFQLNLIFKSRADGLSSRCSSIQSGSLSCLSLQFCFSFSLICK